MNLGEQLAKVQQELAAEKEKGAERNIAVIQSLEEQEAQVLKRMDESVNGVQDVPQSKVREIKLDYDFNTIFNHPHANEAIVTLIQTAYAQVDQEHAKEVSEIHEEHKRELDLKNIQFEEVNQQLKSVSDKYKSNTEEMYTLMLDLEDLRNKRDAAVKQYEEAQEQLRFLQVKADALEADNVELRKKVEEGHTKPVATIVPTSDLGKLLLNPLRNSAEETRTDLPPVYEVIKNHINPFPTTNEHVSVGEGSSSMVDETTADKIRVLEEQVTEMNRRITVLESI